jgi:hypothetical protein
VSEKYRSKGKRKKLNRSLRKRKENKEKMEGTRQNEGEC